MPVSANPTRYAHGLLFGLFVLFGLEVIPLPGTPLGSTRVGEAVGFVGCGQWLPLEALVGAEDMRRPTAPLNLRRPGAPEAGFFRAPARARVSQEFRMQPVAGEAQRHVVVFDGGRRPLRL